ncbi:MAG: respiratory nitrate reductase subunit gamma [Bauldia sp.]|nr:respiratory nitrate reductase subunit gamma [Bauldia sp.]
MSTLLWAVFPYVALTLFFVVPFIRMIYRPFGLTTRASGMFNRGVLGFASLLLHWGIILLFIGHLSGFFGGLVGSQVAVGAFFWIGLVGGAMAIVGSFVALVRRLTVPEVRALSQLDDYVVHLFIIAIIALGLYQSVIDRIWGAAFPGAAWFASLWRFRPEPELMAGAGLFTQIHVLLGFLFAAYFPFTKLIHVWTYPINIAVRPYQSMRTAANKFRRKWEFALRTDKSFLTYFAASMVLILVAAAFLIRPPTLGGLDLTTPAVEVAAADTVADRGVQNGYPLYVSQCARCHGVSGDGNGLGKDSPTFGTLPRDLTAGLYRFVSTQSGIASDADLRHVIVEGLPSSGMPGFAALTEEQVASLVTVLDRLWVERPEPGPAVAVTPQPPFTQELRGQGRQLYADNCASCHGARGAGDGDAAAFIEDFPGHPLPPANLAAGEVKAGTDPVQLYYRIAAGIPNGDAPLMPSFSYLTPEEIWALVAYLRAEILPRGTLNGALAATP